MTSSLQPLMPLQILMMMALATCSTSMIFMYQSDFVSPSPFTGGIWVVFISCTQMILYQSWLLSQAQHVCETLHCIFIWPLIMPAVLYGSVPRLLDTLFFCTLSRRAQVCLPRRLQHRYPLIKRDLLHLRVSSPQGLVLQHTIYLIFLSLTYPLVVQ